MSSFDAGPQLMMYNEHVFRQKLERALKQVKVVLETAKHPKLAEDVHHAYQDKYLLAEFLTRQALSSEECCLSEVNGGGDFDARLQQLQEWTNSRMVSLRFQSDEHCAFDRKEEREVEASTRHETSITGDVNATLTSKLVTKVTEYFWKFSCSYKIVALRGVGAADEDRLCLSEFAGEVELKSQSDKAPFPEIKSPAATFDVDISWFLKAYSKPAQPGFQIDKNHAKCFTPCRNPNVTEALSHFTALNQWCKDVSQYVRKLLTKQPNSSAEFDFHSLESSSNTLFVPILPVLKDVQDIDEPETGLLIEDVADRCLSGEEGRSLQQMKENIAKTFGRASGLIRAEPAMLIVTLLHLSDVCTQYHGCISYLENMLRKQLIAAIGKEVTPAAFGTYMRFHNRKLFASSYLPLPFCFAVRRSENHTPEGTVSIEELAPIAGEGTISEPIVTMVAKSDRPHPMQLPLSASTVVNFHGERYLHACLLHEFSGSSGAKLSLVSRARQFSSMIVLVGRIASANSFEAKYASIIRNKDELSVPLELSTLPTPKEFKDAIESLSPEQQSFAKAFRAMQLESTLFGILIIQIKPQLEKVLNLAVDTLTKEIKLTQDLMDLFIKYQIPSDLLSYDNTDEESGFEVAAPTAKDRLEAVREHVKAMQEMVDLAKKEEIEERRMEAAYAAPRGGGLFGGGGGGGGGFASKMFAPGGGGAKGGAPGRGGGGKGGGKGGPPPGSGAPPPPCAPPAPGGLPPPCPSPSLSAAASAPPTASTASVPQPEVQQNQQQPAAEVDMVEGGAMARDYTQVPVEMDRRFEQLDSDGTLRPTIITASGTWRKKEQKALLAEPTSASLSGKELKQEKDAAFDLIDALTKSGALPVEHASLHIVVAATHCFDKTVTETVVQDSVNPIEKVERSQLIMASTIHQQPISALIQDAQRARCEALILEDAKADGMRKMEEGPLRAVDF